jgi:pimeloyl-ACP methyl ester carboxylesterase
LGGFAEAPVPAFIAHLTIPQIEGTRTMAKHAPTTTRTIAPSRGSEGSVRADLRSRLLSGFLVTERRLSLNNLSTEVLQGGGGSPIVLLHGPAAYALQWRRVIPNLVTTHRVIAPGLPGHGASDSIDRAPDPEFVSGWLDDLIECTCDVRPVVVGHTLGGAMAARFASERSDRLAALMLVDTLGVSPFHLSPEFDAAVHEFLSDPTESTLNGLWNQCLFDLPTVRRRIAKEWNDINAYTLDRIQAPARLSSLRLLMDQFGMRAIPEDILVRIAVPCRPR